MAWLITIIFFMVSAIQAETFCDWSPQKGPAIEWISLKALKLRAPTGKFQAQIEGDMLHTVWHNPTSKQKHTFKIDITELVGLDKIQLDSLWLLPHNCHELQDSLRYELNKLQNIQVQAPKGYSPITNPGSNFKPKNFCEYHQQEFFNPKSLRRNFSLSSYGKIMNHDSISLFSLSNKLLDYSVFIGCESDRTTLLAIDPTLKILHLFEIPEKPLNAPIQAKLHIPWNTMEESLTILKNSGPKYKIQRNP